MDKIRPLADRVILKRAAGDEKSKGGIIIPDVAKETPIIGTVVAVGPGKIDDNGFHREIRVTKGQRVIFGRYAGTEIKLDGVEHLIVTEGDIYAVLED